MKPSVIVAPDFRAMSEIFDAGTLARLHDRFDVVWGRDGPMPAQEFREALGSAFAVVFGTWHYGPGAIDDAGPGLRCILEVAGGHDHPDLDYRACLDRGIAVGSCAHAFGPAVAEMALALTLAANRSVPEGDAAFRRGEERWLHAGTVGARTLFGATVGFVGAGGLARSLQPLLEPFGVEVLGHDPFIADGDLIARSIEPVTLESLFDRSDVVFVLAAPSPSNRHLVTRGLMERLGPEDLLVVVSRAHLVDFEAMTDLVLDGRFRVAVDVFPSEPFDPDHRIRPAPNAVFSSHRAGAIPFALLEIGHMVVDDLIAFADGGTGSRMQYATSGMIDALRS
jgi:phosphoglycerate dehydrogenase-like enzyme